MRTWVLTQSKIHFRILTANNRVDQGDVHPLRRLVLRALRRGRRVVDLAHEQRARDGEPGEGERAEAEQDEVACKTSKQENVLEWRIQPSAR